MPVSHDGDLASPVLPAAAKKFTFAARPSPVNRKAASAKRGPEMVILSPFRLSRARLISAASPCVSYNKPQTAFEPVPPDVPERKAVGSGAAKAQPSSRGSDIKELAAERGPSHVRLPHKICGERA